MKARTIRVKGRGLAKKALSYVKGKKTLKNIKGFLKILKFFWFR